MTYPLIFFPSIERRREKTMWFLLSLLSIPIFLLFLLPRLKGKASTTLYPSGPHGLPLVGNLFQIYNSSPHLYFHTLSQTYGPLFSLKLGSIPAIVVSSEKLAKEVFTTNDLAVSGRPPLLGQQKLSYDGRDLVFSPYNDEWRELRKVCIIHLFSSKRVQSFLPIREEEISRMISRISGFASSSKVVNLSEILMSLTSSIVCRVAFGRRYDEEGHGRSKFHSLLNETQAMFGSFFFSDYFPLFGWLDKLTGMSSRLEKNFKEMDAFYQEIIDEHLRKKEPKSRQEDITDIFLQLKEENSCSIDLTFDHIKAVLMNILVAGTDTGAAALVWAMTALIKNPSAMKKAQEEIRSVGDKGQVEDDDLHGLHYLKAVIKESMRLFPPAPLLVPRETVQNCTIGGYEIQPNTLIHVNAWAIGRDPESWENPEEFSPERFLGSDIDFKGQDFGLIPFGAGRRGCPGIHMGTATVELALANLLYAFDWELPAGMKKEDVDIDVLPGITMHKKNELCLVPRNYNYEK